MNLCDRNEIQELLQRHGFRFSKSMGQNFLIESWVPEDIAAASGADRQTGVLEIGPGIGVLTKELAKRAAKVVSIEVDERLPPLLAETMAGVDNFKLILQDVLKVDLKALIAEEFPGMPVAVCANLPYYITSPIVMKLLGDRLPIESLTVMVQKEAADRLAAAPGSMGLADGGGTGPDRFGGAGAAVCGPAPDAGAAQPETGGAVGYAAPQDRALH